MTLYLVRHGETDWNVQKRFQSRSDVQLNATGLRQAERMRDFVQREKIDFAAAFCSPLARARRTAEIILEGCGVTLSVDDNLQELSLGDFEGRYEAHLRDELGCKFEQWRAKHFREPAPNGESVHDAIHRLVPLVERLRAVDTSGNLMVVAHQGINMAMMAAISGRTDLASLASFKQRNDQVVMWDLASNQHLGCLDI